MPCYHPLQANFTLRPDGKKDISFSDVAANLFSKGVKSLSNMSLPCGRCMGCRLERSRQWAVRCVHEANMYEENCFVTFTFAPENLDKVCPKGSLDRSHMQNFFKRLRQALYPRKIRFFCCGEYGEQFNRPHYHALIFNYDFPDKEYVRTENGNDLYSSLELSKLWPYGFCTIGALTFESAAYVARYCTKKINGSEAEAHYKGRLPEFCQASLKPGIGRAWIDKYGSSDVYSFDEVVMRGFKSKPPRYYDKVLQSFNPDLFEAIKARRVLGASAKEDDNTYRRLLVKEKCKAAKMKSCVRKYEHTACAEFEVPKIFLPGV